MAAGEPAPHEDHGRAGRSRQQDEARDIAVELIGRQPGREHLADEEPAEQCHREGLDRPVDEQRDPDAAPVLPDLMQGTEVDFQQHGDDHHPDEQAHGQVDLRHFHGADGLERPG